MGVWAAHDMSSAHSGGSDVGHVVMVVVGAPLSVAETHVL